MFNLMILGYLILMLYAYILVNRINKTERKLLIAKEVIDEQNEKIKLLENELDEIEIEELYAYQKEKGGFIRL